jgi:hypothetical protein
MMVVMGEETRESWAQQCDSFQQCHSGHQRHLGAYFGHKTKINFLYKIRHRFAPANGGERKKIDYTMKYNTVGNNNEIENY